MYNIHVRMYVCMYVCIYVHVCMYVCMYVHVWYLDSLKEKHSWESNPGPQGYKLLTQCNRPDGTGFIA